MDNTGERVSSWSDDQAFQDPHTHIMTTSEIVEIDESRSCTSSAKDGGNNVYVAVGKDDIDVLKWALDHAVLPGASVFLVHVFPPANYIPTPVGKMPRSQASQEQVRIFLRDENVKRRNILQKYVRLCNDAKVTVETMLIESDQTPKAILELIPVLTITTLVMGTKKNPSSRSKKGRDKGEIVQKNAPEFCDVIIVFDGKKVEVEEEQIEAQESNGNSATRSNTTVLNCLCFSGKST